MTDMNSIIKPIASELKQFNAYFDQEMAAESEPLSSIFKHLQSIKGKQLRPALVFLTAHLFGDITNATYRAATFVEMLHTATLIHDDVVDASEERRGTASVNALWSNFSAVLAGDYLLAKAVRLIAQPDTYELLTEMIQSAVMMSEGELIQSQKKHDCLSKEEYLDIITRKTAMLLRACCVAGALSVKADKEATEKASDFGLNLGIVFQMRDDLLDNESPECVAYAKALMPAYLGKTLESLAQLPASAYRDAMKDLAVFCAERNN